MSENIEPMLHGRGLRVARLAWLALAALALTTLAAGVPVRFEELRSVCTPGRCAEYQMSPAGARKLLDLGLSTTAYAAYYAAVELASASVFFATAAVVFWRRSAHWVALFVAFTLVALGATVQSSVAVLTQSASPWHWPASLVTVIGLITFFVFFYLYPDGRFVPRWTRVPAVLLSAWWLFSVFLGWPLPEAEWLEALGGLVFFGGLATCIVAQVYRYRRVSGPLERQQARWLVFGFSGSILLAVSVDFLDDIFPLLVPSGPVHNLISITISAFSLTLIPVSIGVSIFRYRLYEIDVIVNRALVYGALTASLAAVYFGGVTAMQAMLRALTGQESNVAVVASTLAIAALFQSLRRRVQGFIDRRFYRRKYDAARTLQTYSAHLRDEVDLDALTGRFVGVVEHTLQPQHVSVWLRPTHIEDRVSDPS